MIGKRQWRAASLAHVRQDEIAKTYRMYNIFTSYALQVFNDGGFQTA